MSNFDLPLGWTWKTLGEVAEIKGRIGWRGLKKKEYTTEGPILLSIGNISEFDIDLDNVDHLTWERYKESPEIKIRPGDLIMGKDGTLGKVALVRSIPYETTISSTLAKIRPSHEIDPVYLYYYLKSDSFQAQVTGSRTGTAVQHFIQKNMKLARIPVPPLVVQRRIAQILGRAHDMWRKREQANQLPNRIIQSVFRKMFGDPLQSDKWQRRTIADASLAVESGSTPLRTKPENFDPVSGTPLIKVENLARSGYILLKENQLRISHSANERQKRSIIRPGDVLINIVGPPLGKVAYVTEEFDRANINQAIVMIRPRPSLLNSRYLWSLLRFPSFNEMIVDIALSVRQANINLSEIRSLKIPMPPLELQESFCQLVRRIENLRNKQSAVEIKELFHSLMHKAFRGELAVSK
jgi:type I restriction enzyme S subunit